MNKDSSRTTQSFPRFCWAGLVMAMVAVGLSFAFRPAPQLRETGDQEPAVSHQRPSSDPAKAAQIDRAAAPSKRLSDSRRVQQAAARLQQQVATGEFHRTAERLWQRRVQAAPAEPPPPPDPHP